MSVAKNYLVDFGLPEFTDKFINDLSLLSKKEKDDYLISYYGCNKIIIDSTIENWIKKNG